MVTQAAAVVDQFSLRLTFILFVSVVVVTLFTALLTAPQRDEISEFYLGNRDMTPLRNGLAMCGAYLSAATLLGSTGRVALNGYDGLLYLGGTVVAWMMVLLVIAEPLRNSGKYTLGDTLALRLPDGQRSVRLALALCTLAVCLLYLVAQLVGSIALLTQFIGDPTGTTRTMCVVVIGSMVVVYAAIGGMPGATFLQVVKAVMLVAGVAVTAVMVLHHFSWNIDDLLSAAADNSALGGRFLEPGLGPRACPGLGILCSLFSGRMNCRGARERAPAVRVRKSAQAAPKRADTGRVPSGSTSTNSLLRKE